jgi:hypothetical protein
MITGSIVTTVGIEGVQLAKDMVTANLILYGYKRLLLLATGPQLAAFAMTLNLVSKAGRIKNTAYLLSQISGLIIQNEIRLLDVTWTLIDLALFGKIVPYNDNINYSPLYNIIVDDVAKYLDKE